MFSTEHILLFLGVFATTGLLLKWRKKNETIHLSTYPYPPSISSLPFVGSVGLLFVRDVTSASEFFMKKARELGPIFTLRFGNRLVVTLNSKDAIETAFVKNASAFTDRPEVFTETLGNPENKGITFMRKATDWKKPQQLSLSILKEFGFGSKCIMETRICKEIEAMTDFIINKKSESFDPKEMCTLATSNVIMNILFARRRDYELGLSDLCIRMHHFLSNIAFIYDIIPLFRILPSHRQQINTIVESSKVLFECTEAEITQSQQNPDEPCFVHSYVRKLGPDYDRAQLNYLLRDLISAGTDTSSTTLQWALVVLANNPDVQKRLRDEIDAVIPGDRLPTLQDEPKLPYVEATILELTRWRTLARLPPPRVTSRSTVVNGYLIPEGTMVFANLHAVHSDISVWKDPEVFRPERFLDSENNVIGREKVIPFSIGRRSCPGETLARAELFLIFTSLVKRFLVLPPEGQDKINEEPKMPVTALMYTRPFKIRLLERK